MEKENNEKESGKKTKQQITVPFLWEVKPGEPKQDWKTTSQLEPLTSVFQPGKYVASVPFVWEELPGIPLKCLTPETKQHSISLETMPEKSSLLPLPPAYFTSLGSDQSDEESSYDFHDWMSEDFEAVSVPSEESFCFDPLLLQDNYNHVAPGKATVSPVVRLQNPFLIQQNDRCSEGLSSPEDNNSPRSCASRNASLRGAAFLEYMFPLYPPKSAFLDKPGNSVKKGNVQYSSELKLPSLKEHKKYDTESRRERPLNSEELVEQRGQQSYRRKAVQMKANNPSKDFDEEKPYGCFNFGAEGAKLTKMLERWDALLGI